MTRSLSIAALALVMMALQAPALAAPSDTGVSTANLAESRGCEPGVAGPSRPETTVSGYLPASAVVNGPWGDFFGRSRSQITNSLVDWRIFGTNQTVRIHERLLPAAQRVDAAIAAARSDGRFYDIAAAAAWVWRTVGGTFRFSEHAFGTAVDINPKANPYSRTNTLITNMPSWFVDIWEDAGFCWGGYWVEAKDAMHFSWSGPGLTPSYPGRPAPYPPLTGVAPFDRVAVDTTTSVGTLADSQHGLADFSGDGSADLYRLRPYGSGTRLEVAGSAAGFRGIGLRIDLPFPLDGLVLTADHDLDGRPDLWDVDVSGSTVAFDVWTSSSDYTAAVTMPTGIETVPGRDYALTLHDADYLPDVVVIDRSGPTTGIVYSAQSGYQTVLETRTIVPAATSDGAAWALLAADWDVDGLTDLYAVEKGASAAVHIATAHGERAWLDTGTPIGSGAAVLVGDYDGDGRDDLYVLDGARLRVLLGGNANTSADLTYWFVTDHGVWDAGPECTGPHPCDSIGFSDATGVWSLAEAPSSNARSVEFYYGNPGDVPFMGDWDCDGVQTPGLYRRSDGYVYLRDTNSQGVADRSFYFGNPGDLPLVGDFDGDGCDTVSIYRPSQGRFFIMNALGSGDAGLGAAEFSFLFGNPGDNPFTGDFDGDGRDEVGLHRVSSGFAYLRFELAAGVADASFYFGNPGDSIVAGDWDGDGVDTVAIFRPSDGNWYLKLANGSGAADHAIHFHAAKPPTNPVVGHFGTISE